MAEGRTTRSGRIKSTRAMVEATVEVAERWADARHLDEAVRVLADKIIAEFFVQGGRAVGTFGLPAGVAAANATLAVTSEVGELALASVTAWTMKCGWKVG